MPNDEQPQPLPDNGDAGGNESEHPGAGEVYDRGIASQLPDYGEVWQQDEQPLSVRPDDRDEIIVDTSGGNLTETGDVEQGGGE